MHKLFARQLEKATRPNGEVDLDLLGALVVSAYEDLECDRRRTDHSISLMVKELDERMRERERAAELLQAQKLQLDAALNNMSQGLCLYDPQGCSILYNQRYLELMDYSAEAVANNPTFLDRLKYNKARGDFHDDPDEYYRGILKNIGEGRAVTRVAQMSNGRTLRIDTRPMPNGSGWISAFEDLTEQQQREASFHLLFEHNPLPMFVFDIETLRFLAVNDAAVKHYGYSRPEFLNMTALDIRPPAYREKFIDQLVEADEFQAGGEWSHQKSDGTTFVVDVYARQMRYQGRPARLAVAIDVTERARAEADRDRNREFLDRVIDNVTTTIVVKDVNTMQYVLVNRAAEKLWGLPREELIGKTPHQVFPKDVADLIEANDRKLIESGTAFYVPEHKLPTRNGERHVTSTRIGIHNQNGEVQYVLGVIEDITERKRTDDQLRQAQKMEAIGNLTGGVAHDFNNLLTVIMGNLDLLREDIAGDVDAEQKIETILQASERGADLTRRMLAFSRRQPLQAREVDVNALVDGTARLLGHTLGADIRIDVRRTDDLPPALVDASQLEAALLNIAINARDAMPNGGTLTVGTRLVQLDADYTAANPGLSPGTYVAIELTDTGTGMAADVLERIFDPFFTTKPAGKGTGLGLSMVYGFIKQSGGHIKVYSEVGHGTTFRLFLPLASAGAQLAQLRTRRARVAERSGDEVILAVEDNPDLRATVVRQLRDLGYRVHEADNAVTALQILDSSERVDLLFTDMILPGGVNGKELATRARVKRADLKVLFTSGFPGTSDRLEARLERGDVLLNKPYHKRDLAKAVADVLDAAS